MKTKISYINIILIILSTIVTAIVLFFTNNMIFSLMIFTFLFVLSILANDLQKNIYFFIYLLCFFTFLLGRPIAIEIFGKSRDYIIALEECYNKKIYISLILSMIGLAIGYFVKLNKAKKVSFKEDIFSDRKIKNIKKITFALCIICSLCVIIENIIKLIYVRNIGYTASYIQNENNIPYIIKFFSDTYLIVLSIYLATLPNKKEIKIPIILYLISLILFFCIGNRFEIVSGVLLLITYFVLRNKIGEEKWISKKDIFILVLLVPVIILILQSAIYWREGKNIDSNSNFFMEFLFGVGGSSSLIGYVDKYSDKLPKEVLYSFGNIWRWFNNNFITKIFTGGRYYVSQSREYALYGHSLAATLTYYLYPTKYLSGYGLGGCYIAELLHDFSYIGVFLGNIFIGKIISEIKFLKYNDLVNNFLCVFLITLLLRMPRDSFDYFLIEFISLKNIFMIFIIGFLLKICNGKGIKNE